MLGVRLLSLLVNKRIDDFTHQSVTRNRFYVTPVVRFNVHGIGVIRRRDHSGYLKLICIVHVAFDLCLLEF